MTKISTQIDITNRALAFGSETLPSYDDVIGEWWPGSGMTGMTNRVTGVDATLIGSPTIADGYMTVASAGSSTVGAASEKGFLTDVGASQIAVTVVALIRPKPITLSGGQVIAAPSITTASYGLWVPDNTNLKFFNHAQSGTDQPVLPIPDSSKFTMAMGYGANPPTQRLYMTTGGTTPATVYDDGTYGSGANLRDLGHLQVGGYFGGSFGGSTDIAALAIIDGLKDQAWLEALYARWRSVAISRGLPVA